MSLSKLNKELSGLDYAISILVNKRNTLIAQIKKEKICPSKDFVTSKDPKFEKNLKLLRLGVSATKKQNKRCEKVPPNLSLEQIGRSGEVAFWNYLNEVLDPKVCEINWLNKSYELKRPYDFIITICGVEIYVDVKCTRGEYHQDIYMSSTERAFATENSDRYFIARLYQFTSVKDKKYKADSYNVKVITWKKALKEFKLP